MGHEGFIKAFKSAIINFNGNMVHFEKSDISGKIKIKVKIGLEFKTLLVYREKFEIELWKNHFLEYFETGEFDMNAYWQPYTSDNSGSRIPFGEKIYKFPVISEFGNDFYESSPQFSGFMNSFRGQHPEVDLGFEQVPKVAPKHLDSLKKLSKKDLLEREIKMLEFQLEKTRKALREETE